MLVWGCLILIEMKTNCVLSAREGEKMVCMGTDRGISVPEKAKKWFAWELTGDLSAREGEKIGSTGTDSGSQCPRRRKNDLHGN
ncbi:hypothetical protein BIV60_18840 [Bacillus sp. MUM 116]|nr:hypothetical protein BIV60_18840 [Bacillus sp. MUM 116]